LPVFSPTASESGIAGLSDFMFQLSPDVDIIASKLALYAMNQMKMDTFAILAPLDDKGMGLAEAFKKTVEESGGHILIEEYYYPESDSYKEQFMRIRRKALFQSTTFRKE
jgi:ABC-type branched-subunit amino acid transport system substrate-binding protein